MPHKTAEARASYQKQYRKDNADRLRAYQREYIASGKKAESFKRDYAKHAEAYKARAKANRLLHLEEIRAFRSSPDYRKKVNERRRARYASEPDFREATLHHCAAYRAKHGEARKTIRRHRETRKPFWQKRYERALSKAYHNGAQIIGRAALKSYYREVFTQTAAICDYCHGLFAIREIVLDHKQPYALGGCHCVTNLTVSCAPCNRRKHTTPYDKWVAAPIT